MVVTAELVPTFDESNRVSERRSLDGRTPGQGGGPTMSWAATPLRQYPEDYDFGKAFNEDIVGKVMWICVLAVLVFLFVRGRVNDPKLDRSM